MLAPNYLLMSLINFSVTRDVTEGLRCFHTSRGSGLRSFSREGPDAVTCLTAPDHAFPLRRAPTPPLVPWLSMGCRLQE
jgi:hypothetical protein